MRYWGGAAALLSLTACSALGGGPNQLTLHNSSWDRVNVEIVLTKSANCAERGPDFISQREVVLRKDKTEVVDVPPEAAVCWRHDRNPSNPRPGDWTGWSRATLYPGQSADTEI